MPLPPRTAPVVWFTVLKSTSPRTSTSPWCRNNVMAQSLATPALSMNVQTPWRCPRLSVPGSIEQMGRDHELVAEERPLLVVQLQNRDMAADGLHVNGSRRRQLGAGSTRWRWQRWPVPLRWRAPNRRVASACATPPTSVFPAATRGRPHSPATEWDPVQHTTRRRSGHLPVSRYSPRGAAEPGHDSVAAVGETVRDQPPPVVRPGRDLVVLLTAVGYPNCGDERPRCHGSSPRIQQTLDLVIGQRSQFHDLMVPVATGCGHALPIDREHTYA